MSKEGFSENSTYKEKFKRGSNFGIISETFHLTKIVYRKQNIPLGHNVFYEKLIKNR